MRLAVGIGITDVCNCACLHCYSRDEGTHALALADIEALLTAVPVSLVNFGTGESIFHPDFPCLVERLKERGIPASLTSNGFTVSRMKEDHLRAFHDIDISIDFPTEAENDAFRNRGSTRMALQALERLVDLDIERSLATCMTNQNYRVLPEMVGVARSYGANLRVNIFKPVRSRTYSLSYEEFWEGISGLLAAGRLVSCSEPIVNTILNSHSPDGGCSCGRTSLRITPKGKVVPCVYWGESDISLADLIRSGLDITRTSRVFQSTQLLPSECQGCDYEMSCRGGCAGRRYWHGIDKGDPYCYLLRGRDKPRLDWTPAAAKDLIHSQYLCTIIVA